MGGAWAPHTPLAAPTHLTGLAALSVSPVASLVHTHVCSLHEPTARGSCTVGTRTDGGSSGFHTTWKSELGTDPCPGQFLAEFLP